MRTGEITDLLLRWNEGQRQALDRLMPLVVDELRRLARAYLADESSNNTLQPTALVNELYLRLIDRRRVSWECRAHFFGFAATTLRRILVDYARARGSRKRGGGQDAITLHEADFPTFRNRIDLLDLDRALEGLAALDERLSRVVELRYFGGLTLDEAAVALGVGRATVTRDWNAARAFLLHRLRHA